MFIYSNIHYSLIVHLFEQSDIDIDNNYLQFEKAKSIKNGGG